MKPQILLGDMLVKAGVITREQLDKALDLQKSTGAKIGEILLQLRYTTEDNIFFHLARQLDIPYMSLKNRVIDDEVLHLVPGKMARKYNIIPIDKIGKFITIAMSDPLDDEACARVEEVTGLRVQRVASDQNGIREAIERYYPVLEEDAQLLEQTDSEINEETKHTFPQEEPEDSFSSATVPTEFIPAHSESRAQAQQSGYSQPAMTIIQHTPQILDTAVTPIATGCFSPDGKFLASGSMDDTVIWDVEKNKQVAALEGHTWPVLSVAFSPDGKFLASGSMDDTIILWDVAKKKQVAILEEHTSGVRSVSFSPDGIFLASGSEDNTVILWDVEERKQVAKLEGHKSPVYSVAFSDNGKWLASSSEDGTILLWEVNLEP